MATVMLFLKLLTYLIIADAILSWFVTPDRFPRSLTARLTDPLYRPFRAILDPQKTGGLDLSPLLLIVAIQIVQSLIVRAAMG